MNHLTATCTRCHRSKLQPALYMCHLVTGLPALLIPLPTLVPPLHHALTPQDPSGKAAAIVEINSETDFVARNDLFQGLVRDAAAALLATAPSSRSSSSSGRARVETLDEAQVGAGAWLLADGLLVVVVLAGLLGTFFPAWFECLGPTPPLSAASLLWVRLLCAVGCHDLRRRQPGITRGGGWGGGQGGHQGPPRLPGDHR